MNRQLFFLLIFAIFGFVVSNAITCDITSKPWHPDHGGCIEVKREIDIGDSGIAFHENVTNKDGGWTYVTYACRESPMPDAVIFCGGPPAPPRRAIPKTPGCWSRTLRDDPQHSAVCDVVMKGVREVLKTPMSPSLKMLLEYYDKEETLPLGYRRVFNRPADFDHPELWTTTTTTTTPSTTSSKFTYPPDDPDPVYPGIPDDEHEEKDGVDMSLVGTLLAVCLSLLLCCCMIFCICKCCWVRGRREEGDDGPQTWRPQGPSGISSYPRQQQPQMTYPMPNPNGEGSDEVNGTKIWSATTPYVIEKLLGEGGFGAVYKVHVAGDPSLTYAMKIEQRRRPGKELKLKMELKILLAAGDSDRRCLHFTKLIDRGSRPEFVFMVMELVGKSVKDVQRERRGKVFTISTACQVAEQTLEALEDMHALGYIHRDIKPSNLTIGVGAKRNIVYLLDFGISRKIRNDDGEIKLPRWKCTFKGTVKYASLACHTLREQSGKDDLECWVYLFAEFVHPGGLPWRNMDNTKEVYREKRKAHERPRDLFTGFSRPEYMVAVLEYIDELSYVQQIDYGYLRQAVELQGQPQQQPQRPPRRRSSSSRGMTRSSTIHAISRDRHGCTRKLVDSD
ncbi:unnamed protein product, partial [Mesorhabditis spiculigera]